LNPARVTTCPFPRVSKAYIENDDLLVALKDDKLTPLLNGFKTVDYPLHSMKGVGPSLVLYFNQDVTDFSRADQVFKELDIKYRGPAQDVFTIYLDGKGEMTAQSVESNDQSFIISHGYLKEETYSPDLRKD